MVIMEQGDIQPTNLVDVKEFTMAGTAFEVDMVEEVASNTSITYHKWSKMTTKERWEAKNQNKAKGNSQSKIQQVSYNIELFDGLKSSIISAVTQSSVYHDHVNNNDNSNAVIHFSIQ